MKIQLNTCNPEIIRQVVSSFNGGEPVYLFGFKWQVISYEGDYRQQNCGLYNLTQIELEPAR